MAFLRTSELTPQPKIEESSGENKQTSRVSLLIALERMRVALQRASEVRRNDVSRGAGRVPILQYSVVVDVSDLSVSNAVSVSNVCFARVPTDITPLALTIQPLELVSWYVRELQPHFFGMIGTGMEAYSLL